jgi:hypothetical protein
VVLDATPRDWKELFEGLLDSANLHIHEYWLRNVLIILRLVRLMDDTMARMSTTLTLTMIKQHKFALKDLEKTIARGMEPFLDAGDLKLNGIGWRTVTVIVLISCAATFGLTKAYMDRHNGPVPFRLIAGPEKGNYIFEPITQFDR